MTGKSNEGMIGYSVTEEFTSSDILYMLKDLPDACCIFKVLTDPFGTVKDMLFLFVNDKYAALTGFKSAELIGSTFYSTVKNTDEDWIKFSYQAAILRQSSINRSYNSQLDKWHEFWAVPVFRKGFCAFIIHDVTADKRNEDSRKLQKNTNDLVIECAKAVSTPDFGRGIKRVLKIVGQTLEADRIYILRTGNFKSELSYEWVSKTCAVTLPGKRLFDEYDMADIWDRLLGDRPVYVSNDTALMADEMPQLYSKFLAGKVSRYMVAALKDKEQTLGYLVADNYSLETRIDAVKAIETVAIFVSTQIKNQELNNELRFLGAHDALTGLGNRYALNQALTLLAEVKTSVGICYTDINGLKCVNDEKGHLAGDKLIETTAAIVAGIFKKKNSYRIGGDEFIAIVPDIEEDKFNTMVSKLRAKCKGASLAIGSAWCDTSRDVSKLLKQADEAMYKDKAAYYLEHERRHVNNI